ncbi:hypothetical protein [Gandjariella thermophila]|uniref:Uncharacterized protein n=1 Tax=Gandjariella thermophila TaxID=1931992 RepID=A0A4D4JE77_9PSEU|nr:hypothetical protein [Gandjariella thermophila]GDY32676.1 hypothetical protein GTS_43090 [Gandjariella thermophila]
MTGTAPVLLGLLAGEVVVVWLTFGGPAVGTVNVGIVGLVVNIAVLTVAAAAERATGHAPAPRVEEPVAAPSGSVRV